MKTLSIMFLILTLINMPLYIMFQSVTKNNNYANVAELFKYFTMGNLGIADTDCSYSRVNLYDMDYKS